MARTIKCGAVLPLTDFAAARRMAEQAEALGFYAIAAEDHFFMSEFGHSRYEPRLECFTLLSALANTLQGLARRVSSPLEIGVRPKPMAIAGPCGQ